MARTLFMHQVRSPAWELLNQIKNKSTLKTLDQLQTDVIILDFAKPVLQLIQKAFHPLDSDDPILTSWANRQLDNKAVELRERFRAMINRAGSSLHGKMRLIDDEIENILTKPLNCSWLNLDKIYFDDGPRLICYPKLIEDSMLSRRFVDPSQFDETVMPIENDEDDFHVANFNNNQTMPSNNEEEMEIIQIVATSSLQDE